MPANRIKRMKKKHEKRMSLAEERRHLARRMRELENAGRLKKTSWRKFDNRRGQPATGAFENV